MANLIIAPSAENDLNAIVDYISKELCNPEADQVDDELLKFPVRNRQLIFLA